jgi:glycosyltransferase involved in cell wall biosynthesis
MHAIHVVPNIIREASGPSYSVPALCRALADQGIEVELHIVGKPHGDVAPNFKLISHFELPTFPRIIISPGMRRSLRELARHANIMHNHSLWMMPNVYPADAVKNTKCKLMTSPRGTLSEWALNRSRFKKKIMWWLFQKAAVEKSHCMHATALSEYDEIRNLNLKMPVAIIPNGVDIPDIPKDLKKAESSRKLLYLGRIHPKKGVDILIKAWRSIQAKFPDWQLDIVGPIDEYGESMKKLAKEIGTDRVQFPGPVYGSSKDRIYFDSDLFVLPTHSENFGMVVAEALAHGVPAVVSKGAPWRDLDKKQCGWWIDIGETQLSDCLKNSMMISREKLSDMGNKGREWMRSDYSWDIIGLKMKTTYEWIIGGGDIPEWVRQ